MDHRTGNGSKFRKFDIHDMIEIDNIEYKKKGVLGEGNYGKVYEIYDNNFLDNTKLTKAVKIIPKKEYKGENLKSLYEEMEIIEYLKKHYPQCVKNLLCYYSVSEDDKYIYLISEKMDLNSLDYIPNLKNGEKLDAIYDFVTQTIEGLNVLHKLGIIHRDIKPENILTNKNIYKVSDFGLSCFQNKCSQFAGTPSYLHPTILFQQRDSKYLPWYPEDDYFSLGVSVLRLLNNSYIFDEETLEKLFSAYYDQIKPFNDYKLVEQYYIKYINDKIFSLEKSLPNTNKKDKLILFLKAALNPTLNRYKVEQINKIFTA